MQRPDIVRVLGAALHLAAQAEIVAIDLLGLLRVALVEKQRRQRMARRVHPRPWLGVGEVVVLFGGILAQLGAALAQTVISMVLSIAAAVSYVELRQAKEGASIDELAKIFS